MEKGESVGFAFRFEFCVRAEGAVPENRDLGREPEVGGAPPIFRFGGDCLGSPAKRVLWFCCEGDFCWRIAKAV